MRKKWVISIALILVMGSSVFAGLQIHFGGHDCGMMECCMTTHATASSDAHEEIPGERIADLSCFLNCPPSSVPGRTGTSVQFSSSVSVDDYSVGVRTPLVVPVTVRRHNATEIHLQDSHPVYIRHLALLI